MNVGPNLLYWRASLPCSCFFVCSAVFILPRLGWAEPAGRDTALDLYRNEVETTKDMQLRLKGLVQENPVQRTLVEKLERAPLQKLSLEQNRHINGVSSEDLRCNTARRDIRIQAQQVDTSEVNAHGRL